jgi:hypothetical protein
LVTPYTSYLVREEERLTLEAPQENLLRVLPSPGSGRRMEAAPTAPALSGDAMYEASGAGAVQMSKSIRAMRSAEVAAEAESKSAGLVSIKGSTLRQQADGAWVDVEFKSETSTLKLVFASEAYFTFLRIFPEAREFCRLGTKVIFKFRGQFVQIGDSGEKQISAAALQERFR